MKQTLCALLLAITTLVSARGDERPNVVLIMADDIGIEGFGCYGGTSYKTPNIDKLAESGLRYTHAYSQPLCTPTRLQVMTGKYNHRNWQCFGILPPNERTIGHLMQKAGYKTCISGKWQLQSYDPPDYPNAATRRGTGMHPKDAGFDEYQLFHSLHTEDKGSRYADPTFLRNGKLHREIKGKYGEDLNVDFIVNFLRRHRDEPMFVYYPMALPHWPMVPTPISTDWKEPAKRHSPHTRHFPDMVEYMDGLVGRIVDSIEELGLTKKTLVIFYSDNGTHLDITSQMGSLTVPGGKAMPTQTGVRVPLIANWPGTIKPGTRNHLVDSSDFLPTLAEIAGVEAATSTQMDGISFASSLYADGPTGREACFFWYDPRPGWDKDRFTRHIFAVDYKYKLFSGGDMFLIDNLLPIEKKLDPARLTDEAQSAKARLQRYIDQMMQPPLSDAARADPEEFGKP